MTKSTLISVPSEIDQDKLKERIDDKLSEHTSGSNEHDVLKSMNEIVSEIQKGEYGLPQPPKQTFQIQVTVGQNDWTTKSGDWHVNFTWNF